MWQINKGPTKGERFLPSLPWKVFAELDTFQGPWSREQALWGESKPLQGAWLWRYALPLRWPLTTNPHILSFPPQPEKLRRECIVKARQPTRKGLLLQLRDADGRIAWGEIAPLPGLHKETLRQAKLQTQRLLPILLSTHESSGPKDSLANFPESLFPSVRWGTETALWQLGLCHLSPPLSRGSFALRAHDDRRGAGANKLSISALVPPGPPQGMLAHALRRHRQGWRSIKLKVGHLSPALAAELTRKIHRTCGLSLGLRLDVGRRWTLEQALQFGSCVQPYWVEYVEEPVRDPRHIPHLHARTGLWCALDETMQQWPLSAIKRLRGVRTWVIKPALLRGGLQHFFQLARAADEHGITPVVSSCFESSVGLRILALLASECPALQSSALGLGTADWFAADFLLALGLVAL